MGLIPHGFLLAKKKAAIYVALFGLVILGSLSLFQGVVRSQQSAAISLVGAKSSGNDSELMQDLDNDGLPQWEELLFKTDPKNPDTDGDGMKDGEEITEGGDPLTTGVGDLKSRDQNLASSDGALTTELARAIIDSGVLASPVTSNSQIPDSLLKNISAIYLATEKKKIDEGLGELTYSPGQDTASVKKYFNDVAAIFLLHFDKLKKIEFEIFADIVSNKNKKENQALLDAYVAATKDAWNDYKKLAPPLRLKDPHEKGAALMQKMIFELQAFQNYDTDPALSLFALNRRLETRIHFAQFYSFDIQDIFAKEKIEFQKDEAGHKAFNW